MICKIALAICLVICPIVILYQAYVIKTDNEILNSIKHLNRGMIADEVGNMLKRDILDIMHENNSSGHPNEKYVARIYMGYFTSRNLLLFFDDNKRLTFLGWEST